MDMREKHIIIENTVNRQRECQLTTTAFQRKQASQSLAIRNLLNLDNYRWCGSYETWGAVGRPPQKSCLFVSIGKSDEIRLSELMADHF